MKRLVRLLVVGALLFALFEIGLSFIKKGHNITYEIIVNDNNFVVKEIYSNNIKTENKNNKDINNYYFEISINNEKNPKFVFKTFTNYNNHKIILQDIKFYEDDTIKCIYPIFKEHKNDIDVLCNKNNILIDYKELKGTNSNLDKFVNELINSDYDLKAWNNQANQKKKLGYYNIFTSNIPDDDYLILWKYNGIYLVTNHGSNDVELFLKAHYNNDLGALISHYYVLPNYDERYDFSKIDVVNVYNGSIKEVELANKISYNSYFQGIIDNELYLFDVDNKIQYKINPGKKNVIEVGNSLDGIKYYDGNWNNRKVTDFIQEKVMFKYNYSITSNIKEYNYYQLDEVLGETDGYFYFYVKSKNDIKVYRVDKQNTNYIKLLFTIDNISNIKYRKDYIYFLSKDTIYYYHDTTGIIPLAENFEYLFNSENMYDIYKK
ncbi:MAG: hypothetical protein WCX96_01745 [Bacilli bacterium]